MFSFENKAFYFDSKEQEIVSMVHYTKQKVCIILTLKRVDKQEDK